MGHNKVAHNSRSLTLTHTHTDAGLLDDVSLFMRVLNNTEIDLIYRYGARSFSYSYSTSAAVAVGLVLYLPFIGGAGRVIDYAGES